MRKVTAVTARSKRRDYALPDLPGTHTVREIVRDKRDSAYKHRVYPEHCGILHRRILKDQDHRCIYQSLQKSVVVIHGNHYSRPASAGKQVGNGYNGQFIRVNGRKRHT